ncbi:hypothetical protein LWI29_003865 [Acer saccharum]|uniref:CCHC-type domain-containing protein n=1 Tax=Acer saccharum TaxID=4024 RepID=A0AA39S670_ACESA|nr:hypothetical protein LWI29_003865 [Acer saccharum]
MEENECFNDFEIKLMDIVNQSHQLGDPYSDRRIKQKIMRSLPDRFESKVTALEENSGYKDMKPSEKKALDQKARFEEKGSFKKFEPRQEDRKERGPCFECGGIGHFAPDCANHVEKKKGKVMAATWSGSSDDSYEGDESSDDEELMANLLAFASSHKSKSASEERK